MGNRFKIIISVMVVIFIFIIVSFGQELNRRWQYQQEVERLEQEVQELERSVIDLSNLNNYFRTPEYQERIAREKMNYRAAGETVVLIPNEALQKESIPATKEVPLEARSLPRQWWDLFFGAPT